jgi:hypothetical protein
MVLIGALATLALIGALATLALTAVPAHADPDADFLSGSTDALIVGPTGIGDPGAGYISATLNNYLDPAGFSGNASDVQDVIYPASDNYGPSIATGEADLTQAVLAYFGCTNVCTPAEIAAHAPLTLDGYSQGANVISGDEQTLADDGIPQDALRILMVGDTSSTQPAGELAGFGGGFIQDFVDTPTIEPLVKALGPSNLIGDLTPNNLYPTEVFTIQGDFYGDFGPNGADTSLLGLLDHEAYLGLTQAEIDSATTVVDGMTTYYDIPALTGPELWSALIDSLGTL